MYKELIIITFMLFLTLVFGYSIGYDEQYERNQKLKSIEVAAYFDALNNEPIFSYALWDDYRNTPHNEQIMYYGNYVQTKLYEATENNETFVNITFMKAEDYHWEEDFYYLNNYSDKSNRLNMLQQKNDTREYEFCRAKNNKAGYIGICFTNKS